MSYSARLLLNSEICMNIPYHSVTDTYRLPNRGMAYDEEIELL